MKLAYLSGKYTDPRGAHFQLRHVEFARQVAAVLWSLGIAVISPHLNTVLLDSVADYETFMEGDFLQLERSDLMVVLPNWKTSSGTKREIEYAQDKKIPLFYWPADLTNLIGFCHPHGVPKKYTNFSRITMEEWIYGNTPGCNYVGQSPADDKLDEASDAQG